MIQKEKNWPCLVLGIASFCVFLLEFILFLAELKVYGNPDGSPFSFSFTQILKHWTATFIIWGSFAFLINAVAKKKVGIDIFAFKGKISFVGGLFVMLISIAHVVFASYLWDWTFKPITEFTGLVRTYGSNGWIAYVFQVIYYFFENLVMMLVIAYGQEFGERQFEKKNIPWGGILLSLTWGLLHYVTQGSVISAVSCFAIGIYFGICYLLLKKNAVYSWLLFFILYTI